MKMENGVRGLTVFAILCCLILSGCATITRGTKEALVINSDPVGAKVTTSTGLQGTTPATFKVSRKGGFVVTIEREGYETVRVQVDSQVAGGGAAGMAGNVILGGLIGAAIDAGSGAMKKLVPNPIDVKLVPVSVKTSEKPSESVSYRLNFRPVEGDKIEILVTANNRL